MNNTVKIFTPLVGLVFVGVFIAPGGGLIAMIYLALSALVATILARRSFIKKQRTYAAICLVFILIFAFPFFYTMEHQGIFSEELMEGQKMFHTHRIWDWGHIH